MTEKTYTKQEVRKACIEIENNGRNITIDNLQAELTRSKHKFRKGEVVICEGPNHFGYYKIGNNTADVEQQITEQARPLRLSEMPEAITELRIFVGWITTQGKLLTKQNVAQNDLIKVAERAIACFDEEIES